MLTTAKLLKQPSHDPVWVIYDAGSVRGAGVSRINTKRKKK